MDQLPSYSPSPLPSPLEPTCISSDESLIQLYSELLKGNFDFDFDFDLLLENLDKHKNLDEIPTKWYTTYEERHVLRDCDEPLQDCDEPLQDTCKRKRREHDRYEKYLSSIKEEARRMSIKRVNEIKEEVLDRLSRYKQSESESESESDKIKKKCVHEMVSAKRIKN